MSRKCDAIRNGFKSVVAICKPPACLAYKAQYNFTFVVSKVWKHWRLKHGRFATCINDHPMAFDGNPKSTTSPQHFLLRISVEHERHQRVSRRRWGLLRRRSHNKKHLPCVAQTAGLHVKGNVLTGSDKRSIVSPPGQSLLWTKSTQNTRGNNWVAQINSLLEAPELFHGDVYTFKLSLTKRAIWPALMV